MIGSLIGGGMQVAGAGMEAGASYRAAQTAKEAERRQRRILGEFLTRTGQKLDAAQLQEESAYRLNLARARRGAEQNYAWAQQRADAEIYNIMASPAYQAQAAYLADMFSQGIPQSLAQEYAGRLRQAQAARGLVKGGAATQDEAALLTNMAVQQRQALLPQLRQLALDPLQLNQQTISNIIGNRAAAQSMAFQEYQMGISGAQAAQDLAMSQVLPWAQFEYGVLNQMAPSGLDPTAIGWLGAASASKQGGQQVSSLFG